MTTLIISNEEMDSIIKMIKFLDESHLLIKGVSKTIKQKTKEQKLAFIGILLGTLVASLLGIMLTGKLAGKEKIKAG